MGQYKEKVNTSPKQRQIKKSLEEHGHTNVEVWWENVGKACEMCGPDGGYFFHSDQEDLNPIGYSFKEAMEFIESRSWLHKKVSG